MSVLVHTGIAVRADAQAITEYSIPTPNSQPEILLAAPDGNLYITEFKGNNFAQITTSGVITEYPLPNAGSGPNRMALRTDGAIWFTESTGNRIGRFDITTHAITETAITTSINPARWV